MANSIIVKNITKKYKLYKEPIDRLKESLSLSNKSYHQDFLANNNISFTIKKGEVIGIIGKNGSGKSTLLKMITGVLTPTSGDIMINGKITAMLELGAGFNPELSGIENLYLAGSISGFNKDEIKLKIDEIKEFADIGEFIYQPLKTYSSGMKARLGFAFAINTEPEILIIDEALSVGDVAFQRKCYAKIESMCESNEVTVLFVSHSGGVIKQLCSRAILLHSGELVIEGKPKDVVNLYEKFMDSSCVNLDSIRDELKKLQLDVLRPKKEIKQSSYYNPSLKSESMVIHKENGAKIFDIKLLDSSENQVNIINKYETYIYQYRVTFSDNFKEVNLAMRIKNITGIIITGYVQSLKNVQKNKTYNISFKFVNLLNSGEYFFNSGVNSTIYGEFIMLHRVVDGYIIKVPSEKGDDSRGLVDFKFKGGFS